VTCERVLIPGGGFAIVCGRSARRQRCRCGAPETLFCDWIWQEGKRPRSKRSKTCDAPLCASCSVSPAHEKDLCPQHARAFEDWKADRALEPTRQQARELPHG
jgi:hypothetical protein